MTDSLTSDNGVSKTESSPWRSHRRTKACTVGKRVAAASLEDPARITPGGRKKEHFFFKWSRVLARIVKVFTSTCSAGRGKAGPAWSPPAAQPPCPCPQSPSPCHFRPRRPRGWSCLKARGGHRGGRWGQEPDSWGPGQAPSRAPGSCWRVRVSPELRPLSREAPS